MIAENPYQLFTPIHPAWLYRRHDEKLDVTNADLDSIERHFPAAGTDPLFAHYRSLAAANKLYRRRGRKPGSRGILWFAYFAIEDEKARIWDERRSGLRERRREDPSPIHEAAEIVARRMRFGSGHSLLNRISRARIPNNF